MNIFGKLLDSISLILDIGWGRKALFIGCVWLRYHYKDWFHSSAPPQYTTSDEIYLKCFGVRFNIVAYPESLCGMDFKISLKTFTVFILILTVSL